MAATRRKPALIPRILPSRRCRTVRAMRCLAVGHQRPDAAREAEDAWPAFALDLLGAEAKRGDAAIDGKAIARRRPVQRRRDAQDLAPPFAERNGKAAFLAELDIRQHSRLHVVRLFRTLGLDAGDVSRV